MKKTYKYIQRLEKHSIGEDCVQLMSPYINSLTILNKDEILYHHFPNSILHINKYLEDERRKQFPYSNIPTHRTRIGFKKYYFANCILNYDQPYISIGDGKIIESYVVKDRNSALIINSFLPIIEKTVHMTRKELEKLFEQPKANNEHLYIMNHSGGFYVDDNEEFLPSEEQIVTWTKEKLTNKFNTSEDELLGNKYYCSTQENKMDKQIFRQCINNISVDCIPENTIFIDDNILLVRINGQNISIKKVSIRFMRHDYYNVYISDIPVNKYTLEQLKFLTPKIYPVKPPKIIPRLNPGVSKEEIKEAKKLVKSIDSSKFSK